MVKVILIVLLSLAALAYGAFFLAWNLTPQDITSLQFGTVRYSQVLPLGSLAFFGLLLGALVMAVAAWSVYSAQRARAAKAEATVRKAKLKLQAQLETIQELRAEVERLEGELSSLQGGDGTWGQTVYAAPATAEPQPAAARADDDEII